MRYPWHRCCPRRALALRRGAAASDASEPVPLTARNFAGEVLAALEVPASASVREVKRQLAERIGSSPAGFRLLAGHLVLSDGQVLRDLGPPTELTVVRLQWKSTEQSFRRGDLVQLHYDGNVVHDGLQSEGLPWTDAMNAMLGRTFAVQDSSAEGRVALPNPDPAHAGVPVVFPASVVRDGEELARGDIVRMLTSESAVRLSFRTVGYVWHDLMRGMLGREFPILEMTSRGIIALPSPDGSQDGKWYFPVSVVSKVDAETENVIRRAA